MDFPLWKQLLSEAVYWQEIDDGYAFDVFQRTSAAWGLGDQYFMQGVDNVDLTKLYEQYRLLATIKGTGYGSKVNSEDC